MEYLTSLDAIAGTGIEQLHANPNVTWTEAHAIARSSIDSSLGTISSDHLGIRSRESEPLGATEQPGYVTGQYLGSPMAYLNQVRAESPALKIGGWEEKQYWEPNFTEHMGGYIMLGKPIQITNGFGVEQAIAGDYSLAFGNGLGFGGGFGRSAAHGAASAVENRSFGLRGSFLNSARTLLGAALELAGGPAHLYLFTSHRAIDANVVNDTIRTIYSSGLHQTESQLELANATLMSVIGARAELSTLDSARLYLNGGATAYEVSYDHSYIGSSSSPFIGKQLGVVGADALAIGGKWSASAETAISKNDTVHRTAAIISTVFTPREHVSFSLMYSHIPQGFQSPFGEVLGVGTSAISNFDGYYLGVELEPIEKRLRLNAYAKLESEIIPLHDLFGARKHDYLASTFYQAAPALGLTATVRDEQDATVIDSSGTYATVQGETMHVRLHATYRPESKGHFSPSFRTYFEAARYVLTNTENGWSAAEEVRIPTSFLRSELQIKAMRFETASSNTAMWIYGSGVPGAASIDPFDGLGWRLSLRATVHALESLGCSAYLAGTLYDTPHTLGSGLSARTGTSDFTATVQVDVRL